MRFFLIVLILNYGICFSQTDDKSLNETDVISTYYSNTLSVHPFGVFISRISNNFQLQSENKFSITANISTGNVWLPYVKTYSPLNETDRIAMKNSVWHEREGLFDAINTPSKTTEFHADGVIRQYQIKLNIPIAPRNELKVSCRMFSLDKGKAPYSLLTSDQFIEWFHSNVAGGEDPFARKVYGLDQAKISYKDENGKKLYLDNGDFIFSGVDAAYYTYPQINFLKKRNIYTNIGLQIGANVTKVNPSMDLGLNSTLIKKMGLKNKKKELHLGLSLSALRQKIIRFGDGVQLSNKKYILNCEPIVEYIKRPNNRRYFSITTGWSIQSSYNKKSDFDYLVLKGERITSHWHYTSTHLYRALSASTLTFTYGIGTIAFWMYLREDFVVDNAPDVQTGIGFKFYFK